MGMEVMIDYVMSGYVSPVAAVVGMLVVEVVGGK